MILTWKQNVHSTHTQVEEKAQNIKHVFNTKVKHFDWPRIVQITTSLVKLQHFNRSNVSWPRCETMETEMLSVFSELLTRAVGTDV